jgi:hypothetical protein
MAARLEEAGEDALVTVVPLPGGGRARLSMEKLGALGESESLAWLRAICQAMLPRIDLSELLLEVHAWTGFLDAYVHLADISTRMSDLPRTLVALLISEACNVDLTPVIKAGDEVLTRGRLSRVDQNYVRGETQNDQVAGIGQMVVPGTPRDSPYILDTLIDLDAGPKPEIVTTD